MIITSYVLNEKVDSQERISLLGGDERERGRRLEILQFQIEEIETVDLKEGEEDELLIKKNKIHNLEKIISSIREASNILIEENGVSFGASAMMQGTYNWTAYYWND